MNKEEVKKYVGKKVLIVLDNGFKYTAFLSEFNNETFTIVDRYGKTVTISCSMISLITEAKDE